MSTTHLSKRLEIRDPVARSLYEASEAGRAFLGSLDALADGQPEIEQNPGAWRDDARRTVRGLVATLGVAYRRRADEQRRPPLRPPAQPPPATPKPENWTDAPLPPIPKPKRKQSKPATAGQ